MGIRNAACDELSRVEVGIRNVEAGIVLKSEVGIKKHGAEGKGESVKDLGLRPE